MAVDFGAVTNLFTGDPVKEAAAKQQQYLAQQQAQQNAQFGNTLQTGLASLGAGQSQAINALASGYGTARGDLLNAINLGTGALTNYGQQGVGALTDAQTHGLAALQGGVNTATGAYDPLRAAAERYGVNTQQASQAQADALGLNGPEGIQRAQAAFQTSPGYQFQLGQGLDALTRAANITGAAAGGNTLQAAQQYGQGLANQEWNNYLTGLQGRQQLYAPLEAQGFGQYGAGVGNIGLTGGTNAANIYGATGANLANLYGTTGQQLANAYGNYGNNLANLSNVFGQQQAGVYTSPNTVNFLSGISGQQANFNQSIIPQYNQTFADIANAEQTGSKNLWGLGLSLAQLAAGGGLGGGNTGTALGVGGGGPSLPFFLKGTSPIG